MPEDMSNTDAALVQLVTIKNKKGLHARASAKFVKCAGGFAASIDVTRDGTSVTGTSIMGLMMLAAGPGTEIEIRASGTQAQEAMDALVELIEACFDED